MELGIILWLIGLTGLVTLSIRWSNTALDELEDVRKKLRNSDHRTDKGNCFKGRFND